MNHFRYINYISTYTYYIYNLYIYLQQTSLVKRQEAQTWMICCRNSGLILAKMANIGQFATNPPTIRKRDGRRRRSEWVRCDEE